MIDKPVGPSSFDVVRRVRKERGVRRVGHGGTLDPMASGVLPVCVGEATKLAQFLLDADKEYEAVVCFGVETDTYDAAGAVTARGDASAVTEEGVRAALEGFRGAIRQVPPRHSALKHKGRPLYAYARAGEEVAVPARTVVIRELTMSSFDGPERVGLRVRCSKGTYIRSLAFDLGRALGSGAHLAGLRRTRSGPFAIGAAHPLDAIVSAPLVSLSSALGHLPALQADDAAARDLAHGKRVPCGALCAVGFDADQAAARRQVLRPDGTLLAVVERRAEDDTWQVVRMFN